LDVDYLIEPQHEPSSRLHAQREVTGVRSDDRALDATDEFDDVASSSLAHYYGCFRSREAQTRILSCEHLGHQRWGAGQGCQVRQ
jgi:hypothetical protein